MDKKLTDCILNSVCCNDSLMLPAAWYGDRTTYRCCNCNFRWTLSINTFSLLTSEVAKVIRNRDIDFQIKKLKEAKEKNG